MKFGEACDRYNKYKDSKVRRIDDIERFAYIEELLNQMNCSTTEELIKKLDNQLRNGKKIK